MSQAKSNAKVKSNAYCVISFCVRNAIKNETKNVNKNSLFCSIL